jgi:uncharacterized paraquat-inducible protein A
MKSICTKCEIIYITRIRMPLKSIRCPVCKIPLKSYKRVHATIPLAWLLYDYKSIAVHKLLKPGVKIP